MTKRPADNGLVPSHDEVNRRFYASNPADYFRIRLQMLLLLLTKREDLDRLMAEGIEHNGFRAVPVEGSSPPADEESRTEAVAITDSEVLLHHTVETLLRLYLAHAGRPACPALEVARVRYDMKQRVSDRFRSGDPQSHGGELADVFLGASEPAAVTLARGSPDPAAIWSESVPCLEAWLRYFAGLWLDRADVYNAAKHGFGVTSGQANVQFPEEMGEVGRLMGRAGPAISYISLRNDNQVARPRWFESTAFVDTAMSLALISQAIDMTRALWDVARARYCDAPLPTIRQWSIMVADLIAAASTSPYRLQSMHVSLAYFPDPS